MKNNEEIKNKQTKTARLSYASIIIWMTKRDEKCSRQKHKLHIGTLVKIIIYFDFAFIRKRIRDRKERKKYRINRSFDLCTAFGTQKSRVNFMECFILHASTYSSAFRFSFLFFLFFRSFVFVAI